MKKQHLLIGLAILLVSCRQTAEAPACGLLEPRAEIKALLDSFVKVNGSKNADYGLYIDKTSPHEYDLIIYTGKGALTKKEDALNHQYPVNKVLASEVEFNVYSGVEHYFLPLCKDGKQSLPQKTSENDDFVIWAVRDSFGILTTYEASGAYPFIGLPGKLPENLEFKLPGGSR
ncbi:hypothetical protein HHL16_23105 [Pseudoflavitalea sp. G-6-1-2]|uniref:hypothetical protein n=1 Tax=Pseudoflavitalea sp. G-6-1-2 TaxID=2728841 RepID=UPI00146A6CFB|nr:hypothetical protein [Pseudoflavitalea sp. G-6-1-2]NML23789.1 hypothetical protein [Pseudoflavitalea sp. G-6-1-2]